MPYAINEHGKIVNIPQDLLPAFRKYTPPAYSKDGKISEIGSVLDPDDPRVIAFQQAEREEGARAIAAEAHYRKAGNADLQVAMAGMGEMLKTALKPEADEKPAKRTATKTAKPKAE